MFDIDIYIKCFQATDQNELKKKEVSAPTGEEKENIHCGKHECALEFHSRTILYKAFSCIILHFFVVCFC